MKISGVKRMLLYTAAILLVVSAFFRLVYRPWQMNWGATAEEIDRPMPGDEIVREPNFKATRAVTVNAPPERIWPWIVQIGYRRAGFYSWDLLDNDGIASSERIIAEYQILKPGDHVPLSKTSRARVVAVEPPRHLLLVFGTESPATWAWGLYPIDAARTRLVTRLRVHVSRVRTRFMLDAFEIVMMRKHLLGIKRRAEPVQAR